MSQPKDPRQGTGEKDAQDPQTGRPTKDPRDAREGSATPRTTRPDEPPPVQKPPKP